MENTGNANNRVPVTLRNFFFQDPFFQTSWDDFEKIRQDMMRDSQALWSRFGEDSMNMLRQDQSSVMGSNDRALATADSQALTPMIYPRRWMFPRFLSREDNESLFPSDFSNFKQMNDQILNVKDDDTKFELSLDTHDYRPDEIKVNLNQNVLSVEAKHEEKGEGNYVSRQFSRKYTLPENCEIDKVSSNLSSDGILMITAPKNLAIKDQSKRAIPITKQ